MHNRLAPEKLTEQIETLLHEQIENWAFCQEGYRTLDSVKIKTVHCGNYEVRVQCNPGRIKSSTAKVDKASITQRACFLCQNNRPAEQKGVMYHNDYIILCNPAPIFDRHFTVAHMRHVPQFLEDHLEMIFQLSCDLNSEYTLIYNGPQSGASAPDHFHLQAFTSNIMPIEKEACSTNMLEPIHNGINIIKNYDRTAILLSGNNYAVLIKSIKMILHTTASVCKIQDEPLVNLIVTYQDKRWLAIIFLRHKHRPDCYFEEGDKKMIISPGTVDMGGIIITPRQEDFDRLSEKIIRKIYREVSLPDTLHNEIIHKLRT